MKLNIWRYSIAGLVAILALALWVGTTSANFPTAQVNSQPATKAVTPPDDGFDKLPRGLQGVSYSTLSTSGKVHRPTGPAGPTNPSNSWHNPFAPLLTIVFGPDRLTGAGAGEPAAGINADALHGIISGNFSIDHTSDGGNSWTSAQPPNPHNSGDVTNAWLEGGTGSQALELSINNPGSGYDYTCARTSDYGATWTTDTGCGTSVSTPYFDDREYIWVDRSPSSPFFGHVYVTTALFDSGGSGSFNTVSLRSSADNGATWTPPSANPIQLVPNNEFALGIAHNEYPSMGISANGTIGYAWHRGLCCGSSPTVGTNNKVMFTRSTDGGATFPFSDTIVTVPLNMAVPFNSTSPFAGQRWSDTPNIAADPVTNGTFYAVWTQYRTANSNASAAIYLSKTTDNGATWSTPVIPYNNPNGSIFQGFGWVKVTPDHTVHITYLGGTSTNNSAAQFYVQSTDGGATFSAPFQLNTVNPSITSFTVSTDYEANDVTLTGGTGAILAGWADQSGHHARIGNFVLGTPTNTVTGTPPTATNTSTPTNTSTATNTPSATATLNPCLVANYSVITSTQTIVAGTSDIGNHGDDMVVTINLPFSYQLYGQSYSTVGLDSNGRALFTSSTSSFSNACLPVTGNENTIDAYWDDLVLTGAGQGIFTSTTGTAPNRILNIEWRAAYFSGGSTANFELRLYEGQQRFDVIYGTLGNGNTTATGGVQRDTAFHTQIFCNGAGSPATGAYSFSIAPCNTGTVTSTPATTNTPGMTASRTSTAMPSGTSTTMPSGTATVQSTSTSPAGTATSPADTATSTSVADTATATSPAATATTQATATATACPIQFADVQPPPAPNSTFYTFVRCLVCRGIVTGYACGGVGEPCNANNDPYYRPGANVTRGQLSKIVANSARLNLLIPPGTQSFSDVKNDSPFFVYIEALAADGDIGGYACGPTHTDPQTGAVLTCDSASRPYFLPANNATRGQISKIVSSAAKYSDDIPPMQQTFTDVPPSSPFWIYIERLSSRHIIDGYDAASGRCSAHNPPYAAPCFLYNDFTTRGQMAKIAANAFFPNCQTASPEAVKR